MYSSTLYTYVSLTGAAASLLQLTKWSFMYHVLTQCRSHGLPYVDFFKPYAIHTFYTCNQKESHMKVNTIMQQTNLLRNKKDSITPKPQEVWRPYTYGTVQLQLHFYMCVHEKTTQLPHYLFAWTTFPRAYCTCHVLYRSNYTRGTIFTHTHMEHDTCVNSKLTEYRVPPQLWRIRVIH